MTKITIIATLLVFASLTIQAQSSTQSPSYEKSLAISRVWQQESERLSSYYGLVRFSTDTQYSFKITSLLNAINTEYAILHEKLTVMSEASGNKSAESNLKYMEWISSDYTPIEFIDYLYSQCERSQAKNQPVLDHKGRRTNIRQSDLIEAELEFFVSEITLKVEALRYFSFMAQDTYVPQKSYIARNL